MSQDGNNATNITVSDSSPYDQEFSLGKLHCTTTDEKGNLHHGHITVTSTDIMFETAIRSKQLWKLGWDNVRTISKARTDDGLRFEVGESDKYSVDALKGRDELFTQIIGFSGLKWQVGD